MENNNGNSGMDFVGFLTIVFIVLKLCKVINWSWIWVLSPLWITFAIIILAIIIINILTGGM